VGLLRKIERTDSAVFSFYIEVNDLKKRERPVMPSAWEGKCDQAWGRGFEPPDRNPGTGWL